MLFDFLKKTRFLDFILKYKSCVDPVQNMNNRNIKNKFVPAFFI